MIVYVLNKHREPLMPCSPGKARRLLKSKKARVVNLEPFTIQLLYGSSGYKQPVTLGIDPGYKNVGISVVSDKRELYRSEVELRTDIPKLMEKRRMFRRSRRGRKTRYREPRFLNRGHPGWLAPSIRHKLDSCVRLVDRVRMILPISKVVVEVASFDIQKIKNPDIEGEMYQQGEMMGFWNVREYVLHRDDHRCRHCHGKSEDKILQVHHIHGKKHGATNRPEELLTVCKTCHDNHHKGLDVIVVKFVKRFKPETFMTTIRWKLVNILGAEHTYGYITKNNRIRYGLEKSHSNDAFVIAGGGKNTERLDVLYYQRQVRRNNRKLFKGNRSEIPNKCGREVFGFRLFDRVLFEGEKYFVWGRRKNGSFLLKNLSGDIVNRTYKKLRKIQGQSSFLTETQFFSVLKNGVLLRVDDGRY